MSTVPNKEDSVDSTMRKMAQAKKFALQIGAFQLFRSKDGM